MGFEKDKETPPPYDPNGKGFVGEGWGAKEAPLKDADEEKGEGKNK